MIFKRSALANRVISFVLSFMMVVSMICALPLGSSAASYVVTGKYTVSIPLPGYGEGAIHTNCWEFAQMVYNKIWGVGFDSYRGTSDDMLRNVATGSARAITAANTKKFISAAPLGAVIRITDNIEGNDGNGTYLHSQVLIQKDSNGFTVYQSNMSGGTVKISYYTWDSYASGWANWKYFKYIKYPNATAYTEGPHTCDKGSFVYFWSSHPHYNCYACSVCGTVSEDRSSGNYYSACDECNASVTADTYYLKNKATGTYLDVHNANDYDFANVGMCTFNGSAAQKFTLSSGSYGYILQPGSSSTRILNAYGSAPGDGSNVDIYPNVSESSQQWKFEPAAGGGYYIHNMYAPSCVLDTNGDNALIVNKHGGDSQIWYLESVKDASTPSKPEVTGLKNQYTEGEDITFTWTETTNTTHYNLWLYAKAADGTWETEEHTFYAENGKVRTLDAGEYKLLVQAYNSNVWNDAGTDWLCTQSDEYYFSVTKKNLPFVDIEEGKWYYPSVEFAVDNGLFNGVDSTHFAPDRAMSRAMLVSVLYRMEGSPAVSGNMPFGDVEGERYYYSAVLWASQNGIVNGVSEDSFAPDAVITREQMAAILYRYSDYKGYDISAVANLLTYPDATEISNYAITAMSWANSEGLITGTTSGDQVILNPKGEATRAQVATILMRFMESVE